MKKILKKDIVMWGVLLIIMIFLAYINTVINRENSNVLEKSKKIEELIEKDAEEKGYILEETPIKYIKENKVASLIEIKNVEIDKNYTEVKYTLKNNYDFDICISPEIISYPKENIEKIYYDFDKVDMVIGSGEEKTLNFYLDGDLMIKREDLKFYKVIYKNDENLEKELDVIGYVEVKK